MAKSSSRKQAANRRTLGDTFKKVKQAKVEQKIHQHLVHLEELDTKNREFWRNYQAFLAFEREKSFEKIIEALWQARSQSFELTGGRIVGSAYSRSPLCSVGSSNYPGRFNISKIASYLPDFKALYLASDYDTAFYEKYFRPQKESNVNLQGSELALAPSGSFAYYRVKAKLDSVLDVRSDLALTGFCEIIAAIDPSIEILETAKRIGSPPPKTIKTVLELRGALLEENFQQWATWIDQPSPSQWFGHYVRSAGIQGIAYPSVRYPEGFNLAVFPENLRDTDAEVVLLDPSDSVQNCDRTLNKSTYVFLQNAPTFTQEALQH